MIPALEAKEEELAAATVKAKAEPDAEKVAQVKDLQKTLKDIQQKQDKEAKELKNVSEQLHKIVDTKEKVFEPTNPIDEDEKPKPDLTPFKKNLAKIQKEEDEKEEIIEARAEAKKAYPKNPAVEASEIAEEAAADAKMEKFKADYEAE